MAQPVQPQPAQPQPAQQAPSPDVAQNNNTAPTMESILAEMPGGGQDQDPNDDELFAQYNTRLQVVKEEE